MRFAFADTHGYPGCGVALLEAEVCGEVVAEFSDGTVVPAQRKDAADGMHVSVGAYETRSGSRIDAKAWLLRLREGADEWHVVRRIASEPS